MSSQHKDYTVTSEGPINVDGALKRAGDTVSLTEASAKHYAPHIKSARKPKVLPKVDEPPAVDDNANQSQADESKAVAKSENKPASKSGKTSAKGADA